MPELPVIPRPAEPVRPPRVRELPVARLVDEWVPDGADLATPTAGIARYARQLILGNGRVLDPEFSVQLRYGSGVPDNSLGSVGDAYINSSTGWFYEKTGETTWTARGILALSVSNSAASFYCPDGQSRSVSFAEGGPPSHADKHVGPGADKIRDATSAQDGLMTAAYASKLDGVEAAADVTDAANVGSAINGSASKSTPVNADRIPLMDSASSNALKWVSWSNAKATLKAYFDTLYSFFNPSSPGPIGDATPDEGHFTAVEVSSPVGVTSGDVFKVYAGLYSRSVLTVNENGFSHFFEPVSCASFLQGLRFIAPSHPVNGSSVDATLYLRPEWNTSGDVSALLIDVLNTSSGSNANLIDARVGGSPIFVIGKDGVFRQDIMGAGNIDAFNHVRSLYGAVMTKGQVAMSGEGSGILLLTDPATFNSFSRLCFGGTSSSYPSLKRSSTTLISRLADDSANAPFETGTFRAWNGANNYAMGFSIDDSQLHVGTQIPNSSYGTVYIKDEVHSFAPALTIAKSTWGAAIRAELATSSAVIEAVGGASFADWSVSQTGTYLSNSWTRGLSFTVRDDSDNYGNIGFYANIQKQLTTSSNNSRVYGVEVIVQSAIADPGVWGAGVRTFLNSGNLYGLQVVASGTQSADLIHIESSAGVPLFCVDSGGDPRLSSGVKLLSGSGNPNGAYAAPVGSLFSRTDGGAGSTLYVKESGTGNTGWAAK